MFNFLRTDYGQKQGLIDLCNYALTNKKDLIGIEIGSFAGQSTDIFIKTNSFKTLYCIDCWINGYDNADQSSKENQQAQKNFDQLFKNESRIVKIKDYSNNVVNKFLDESIDFIYIDGNHQYEFVKQDLENYFPKIKKGGIISGHDYDLSNNIFSHIRGVKKAVDQFFKKFPDRHFMDGSWIYYK